MKLRNGTQEDSTVVAAMMMNLRGMKNEYGAAGLLAARRVAMGAAPGKAAKMLTEYAMIRGGHMPQVTKNVILSAVTAKGDLISPAG